MQFVLLSYPYNGRHAAPHTKNSDVTACCLLLFVKCEVCHSDFLQFLVHFYCQVHLIGSFNSNSSSQYILLGLTLCNTSNIMYCTIILCHKLVSCSGAIDRD